MLWLAWVARVAQARWVEAVLYSLASALILAPGNWRRSRTGRQSHVRRQWGGRGGQRSGRLARLIEARFKMSYAGLQVPHRAVEPAADPGAPKTVWFSAPTGCCVR